MGQKKRSSCATESNSEGVSLRARAAHRGRGQEGGGERGLVLITTQPSLRLQVLFTPWISFVGPLLSGLDPTAKGAIHWSISDIGLGLGCVSLGKGLIVWANPEIPVPSTNEVSQEPSRYPNE